MAEVYDRIKWDTRLRSMSIPYGMYESPYREIYNSPAPFGADDIPLVPYREDIPPIEHIYSYIPYIYTNMYLKHLESHIICPICTEFVVKHHI